MDLEREFFQHEILEIFVFFIQALHPHSQLEIGGSGCSQVFIVHHIDEMALAKYPPKPFFYGRPLPSATRSAVLRFPRGKGRGTERLISTCNTSKASDLREVYLYLTSQTLEVYLQYLSPDLQRSTLKGPLPFVHKY
jgi:hypothetical protein